jgi:hypothetical protein
MNAGVVGAGVADMLSEPRGAVVVRARIVSVSVFIL